MVDLDVKDKKLLYEIDLNARLGTSKLGKQIGLSQESTHYRLKRLKENKIISNFITLVNFSKLGYTGYAVYARFNSIDKKSKKETIDYLIKNNKIYWVAEFGGKFDLAFAIMAKNIQEFNQIYLEITTNLNEELKDFTVSIRVELTQFPRNYLLPNKKGSKSPSFGKVEKEYKLDETEENILKILSRDARIPVLEISEKIKKPASTISEKIKKLEKEKVIQGYSSEIYCQEYDYESYQLFINTQNLTNKNKEQFYSYCENNKNIIFLIETVGKWNFEIIYEVKNQKELQELIIELRTKFQNIITDLETIVLFNHYTKYDQYPF